MSEILMKLHRTEGSIVMALCDEDLLGRMLKGLESEMKISTGFYGGDVTDPVTISRTIPLVSSINAFGEKSVEMLIEFGMVDRDSILDIQGIPHVQVYSVN